MACYGLLRPDTRGVWLRFVDGRPLSDITIQFLAWLGDRLAQEGKKALLLVWDNAPWHVSSKVREWLRAHNRDRVRNRVQKGLVKVGGHGMRVLATTPPRRGDAYHDREEGYSK